MRGYQEGLSSVVVLDASALIPAAPRDAMLRAASAGLYLLCWSDEILEDVRRNLVSHKLTDAHGASRLVGAMREAFPDALVGDYAELMSAMTNHPQDRHVLATAVAGGANLIVTSNLRHFRRDSLAQ